MGIHVRARLTNKSQPTVREASLPDGISLDKEVLFSRTIYQMIGSLVKNKRIIDDYDNGRLSQEYVDFLDLMDDIMFNKAFPKLPQRDVDIAHTLADEYLGDLGLVQEYHYSKDTVNIPDWLEVSSRPEVRVLMETDSNGDFKEYLIDPVDDTVLVYYTGA